MLYFYLLDLATLDGDAREKTLEIVSTDFLGPILPTNLCLHGGTAWDEPRQPDSLSWLSTLPSPLAFPSEAS